MLDRARLWLPVDQAALPQLAGSERVPGNASSTRAPVSVSGASAYSHERVANTVPGELPKGLALMLELDVFLLGAPRNLFFDLQHRQAGTHEFSLEPMVDWIPLDEAVNGGSTTSCVTSVTQGEQLPCQTIASLDPSIAQSIGPHEEQISALRAECGGQVIIAHLTQGLRLFESCHITAVQTDGIDLRVEERLEEGGARDIECAATADASALQPATRCWMEFQDPVRFNLDTFHISACRETAASLTAALAPLQSAIASHRASIGEQFGDVSEHFARAAATKDATRERLVLGRINEGGNVPAPAPSMLSISFGCLELSVLLVSSLSHSPTPIMRIHAHEISLPVAISVEGAELIAELSLFVDHFNRRIAQWEPMVERCSPRLHVRHFVVGNQTQVGLNLSRSGPDGTRSAERLEVVLSDDALNGMYGALKRVQEAIASPLHTLFERRTKPPYALRNDTGVEVRYVKAEEAFSNKLSYRSLPAGVQEDVSLWELDPVQTRLHCIAVCVRDRQSVLPVNISNLGASIVPMQPLNIRRASANAETAGLSAVVTRVELTEEGSATLLRLCSLVLVVNATEVQLQVGMRKALRTSSSDARETELATSPSSAAPAVEPKFTLTHPHVLEVGGSVSIPVTMLEHGLQMRPARNAVAGVTVEDGGSASGRDASVVSGVDSYHWSEQNSVLWLQRLLEVEATNNLRKEWVTVQRKCRLPDSEYLIHYFSCGLKQPNARRPRGGKLYLTSSAICFIYKKRFSHAPLIIPLAEISSLEVRERGYAVIRRLVGDVAGEADEESAELWPSVPSHRASLRTLRALERHMRAQAPELVLGKRSDEHLLSKFSLPDEAKLLQEFRCWCHKGKHGVVRGRLYLFTTHLAFAGRLFEETTEVIPLDSIKEDVGTR